VLDAETLEIRDRTRQIDLSPRTRWHSVDGAYVCAIDGGTVVLRTGRTARGA
jgi:hypothetical protein